jgi:hypothetical protein
VSVCRFLSSPQALEEMEEGLLRDRESLTEEERKRRLEAILQLQSASRYAMK